MKSQFTKSHSLLKIHTAVLCFGLSGLFGKLLTLPSTIIVCGRVFFATIFLGLSLLYLKEDLKLSHKKDYIRLSLLGIILAVHWTTFFYAIQVSTVAIGLLSYSTFPVFVTFIEPCFLKEKIRTNDIFIAVVTFLGAALVIPSLQLSNQMTQGFFWGMLSGLTFAILSILNKQFTQQYSSLIIAFYQDAIATVVLLPCVIVIKPTFQAGDIWLLVLLGVLFTGVAHTLFISSLQHLKAQTTSIIASLEPVYGIIFAALYLHEIPSIKVIIGGTIILSTALYTSYISTSGAN